MQPIGLIRAGYVKNATGMQERVFGKTRRRAVEKASTGSGDRTNFSTAVARCKKRRGATRGVKSGLILRLNETHATGSRKFVRNRRASNSRPNNNKIIVHLVTRRPQQRPLLSFRTCPNLPSACVTSKSRITEPDPLGDRLCKSIAQNPYVYDGRILLTILFAGSYSTQNESRSANARASIKHRCGSIDRPSKAQDLY
jgi:hypothetical protein